MRVSLNTGERLIMQWGFNGVVMCLDCRSCIEGRDHLFLACGFGERIWREVMNKCLIDDSPTAREDVLKW
jgi:glucan biosynthesis protein